MMPAARWRNGLRAVEFRDCFGDSKAQSREQGLPDAKACALSWCLPLEKKKQQVTTLQQNTHIHTHYSPWRNSTLDLRKNSIERFCNPSDSVCVCVRKPTGEELRQKSIFKSVCACVCPIHALLQTGNYNDWGPMLSPNVLCRHRALPLRSPATWIVVHWWC